MPLVSPTWVCTATCPYSVDELIDILSPRDASSDLPHAFPETPWVQHDTIQPPEYPIDGDRRRDALDLWLLQRDGQQSSGRDRCTSDLGSSSAHRAVHLQCADITMGLLRGGDAYHRFPLRSPHTSRLGVIEFIECPDQDSVGLHLQHVCTGWRHDRGMSSGLYHNYSDPLISVRVHRPISTVMTTK